MKRTRIERKVSRSREDRYEVLPLDPRDPDVLRVKRALAADIRSERPRSAA